METETTSGAQRSQGYAGGPSIAPGHGLPLPAEALHPALEQLTENVQERGLPRHGHTSTTTWSDRPRSTANPEASELLVSRDSPEPANHEPAHIP